MPGDQAGPTSSADIQRGSLASRQCATAGIARARSSRHSPRKLRDRKNARREVISFCVVEVPHWLARLEESCERPAHSTDRHPRRVPGLTLSRRVHNAEASVPRPAMRSKPIEKGSDKSCSVVRRPNCSLGYPAADQAMVEKFRSKMGVKGDLSPPEVRAAAPPKMADKTIKHAEIDVLQNAAPPLNEAAEMCGGSNISNGAAQAYPSQSRSSANASMCGPLIPSASVVASWARRSIFLAWALLVEHWPWMAAST